MTLSAADINGDGCLDLLVGGMDLMFHVILGNGDGTFRPAVNHGVGSAGWCSTAAGDLNRDGKDDVLVVPLWEAELGLYLSREDESFFQKTTLGPERPLGHMFVVGRPQLSIQDFNRDGHNDLAVQDFIRGGISLLKGDGQGDFDSPTHLAKAAAARSMAAGDFNADGELDLLLSGHDDTLTLLTGRGDGSFESSIDSNSPPRALSLATADFNRDGKLDVAAIHQHRDEVSVLLNRGNGTFRPTVSSTAGNLPMEIAVSNFDQDDFPDAVTANWHSSDLTILLGDGTGALRLTHKLHTDRWPIDVAAGDFNRDGLPDISVTTFPAGGVNGSAEASDHTAQEMAEPSGSSSDSAAPASFASRSARDKNRYQISSWTTEHGLPQNTVQCILRTRDGFLWVGTQNGLARFDGRQFRVFDGSSTPSLPEPNIFCLAEDAEGTLWIGAGKALCRYRNGHFERFPLPMAEGRDRKIHSVLPRPGGVLWLTTAAGLRTFHQGQFSAPFSKLPDDGAPNLMAASSSGLVWLGNGRFFSLGRLAETSDAPKIMFTARPLAEQLPGLSALLVDRQERAWFGGYGDLYCLQDGKISIINNCEGDGWGWITALAEDREGGIWLGTGSGVSLIEDGLCQTFTTADGLSDHEVTCLYSDAEGNTWIGTARGGLNRLQPRRVLTYTTQDGLIHDDVWSISENKEGAVWIATTGGASLFRGGAFQNLPVQFRPGEGPKLHWVQEDSSGAVWAGGFHQLMLLKDGRFSPADAPPAALGYLRTAYSDPEGTFWLNGAYAIYHLTNEIWGGWGITHLPGEPPNLVGILRDFAGKLWVGSDNRGLFCIADGETTRLTPADGLTSDYVAPVLAERDGTIWVASDKGLNRLKNGRITRYTTAQGLAENIILNVLEDDDGWFWLNGHRGIHRVRKRELNELAEGTRKSVEVITLGTADGLLSTEGNGGSFPNSCRTRDGRLWFPTTRGVVVIDPKRVTHDQPPPQVWIERIRSGEEIIFNDGVATSAVSDQASAGEADSSRPRTLSLKPGSARLIQIDYTAPAFTAPERVRFKYRLEGYEQDWHDAGTERRAVYTNLRPGSYRFHVIARSSQGVWNEVGDTIGLHLQPYFHQTYWFYGLCVAGVMLAAGGIQGYRLRVQKRILGLEHEASVARERERIARDLHDDLGASLTRIALLSDAARLQANGHDFGGQIEKISDISRGLIDNMSDLVWAANPKFDGLESFAGYVRQYAAQALGPLDVHLDFYLEGAEAPIRLGAAVRRELFLVLKEGLNNALKHGRPGKVGIQIRAKAEVLELALWDDGRGFSPSAGRLGNGLGNMRDRVHRLGGTIKISSREGGGVKVHLTLPLPPAAFSCP